MAEGAEALAQWVAKRKREADRGVVVLEGALLAGGFVRYALRRLVAFGIARGIATVVHVIELTWLYEIFSAKPFVASLALQNGGLVVDAFFWGALEAYRRRARELGPSSEAAALGTRWMALGLRVGAVALGVPLAFGFYLRARDGRFPDALFAYGLVCALRLALDLVVRAYYSGIYAHQRVHRPVASTLVTPIALLGGTWLFWRWLGIYSFVVSLAVAVVASRALLFAFARRAFERHRMPAPSFRRALRSPRLDRAMTKNAFASGLANLTARVASIVLLVAVVPSLGQGSDFGDDVAPLAFALHLASPLVLTAMQWTFVFYHDEKRLEIEAARVLSRSFSRWLSAFAIAIGVLAWLVTVGIVTIYLPWSEAQPTLEPLALAMVGSASFSVQQLRTFARGHFRTQALAAGAMLVTAVVSVLHGVPIASIREGVFVARDAPASLLGLALSPWVGLAVHLAIAGWMSIGHRNDLRDMPFEPARFVAELRSVRGDVIAWDARVPRGTGRVAERIAERLGERGAVSRRGTALVWYERVAAGASTSRREWLVLGGGLFHSLEEHRARSGPELVGMLHDGIVSEPEPAVADKLAEAHAAAFPEGIVVHLGRRAPARFRSLAGNERQAIWRDAVRALRAGRSAKQASGWTVVPYAPDGAIATLFIRPRDADPTKIATWRGLFDRASYRLLDRQARREGGSSEQVTSKR